MHPSTLRPRLVWFLLFALLPRAWADQVGVSYLQGAAHGFVEVTTLEGTRIAVGDLTRRVRGSVVTSRLTMKFLDGSLDDETTVFSQNRVFHLLRDHHVQRGPSFPKPIDVSVDTVRGQVISIDDKGSQVRTDVRMPADLCNGLVLTVVMNVSPSAAETRIPIMTGSNKPRIVHLSIKNAGAAPFILGGMTRQATDFLIHVEIGGVAGVVAPLVGKAPPDYNIMLSAGGDPAFIREDGPFFEGGPIWRIQQISATFPKN
jgi:hypothetical protein